MVNPPACRRVLWILLLVVLSVLSLSVPLARIFASSNLNLPPTPPPFPPHLTLLRFVLIFPTLWWAQLCPRLAQHHRLAFAHLTVISRGCFRFLLCLPSVCSVPSYIQYLVHWLLCQTPFTRITFLNIAFSKAVLNMAFSKTLVYTHVLV